MIALLNAIFLAQSGNGTTIIQGNLTFQNGNISYSGYIALNGTQQLIQESVGVLVNQNGSNVESWYGTNSSLFMRNSDFSTVMNSARATFGTLASGASGLIYVRNGTYSVTSTVIIGKETQIICDSGVVFNVTADVTAIQIDPSVVTPVTWGLKYVHIQMNNHLGNGIYSAHAGQNSILSEPFMNDVLIDGVANGYYGIYMLDPSAMSWDTVRVQYNGTGVYFGHGNVDTGTNYGNSIFNFLDLNPTGNNAVGLDIQGGYNGGNDSLNLAEFHRLQTYPYGGYWNGTIGVRINTERLISFYDSDLEGMSNAIILNNTHDINFYNTFSVAITSASVQKYDYCVRILGSSYHNLFFAGTYTTWGVPYDDESANSGLTSVMKNVLDGGLYLYSTQNNNFGNNTEIRNAYGWFNQTGTYYALSNPNLRSNSFTINTDGTYTYAVNGNDSTVYMDRWTNSCNVFNYAIQSLGGTYSGIPIYQGSIYVRSGLYPINLTVTLGRFTQLIAEPGTTFNATADINVLTIDPANNCPAQWVISNLKITMNQHAGNGIFSSHAGQNSVRSMPSLTRIDIEDVAVGYSGISFADPSAMYWDQVRILYYGTGVTFKHGTLDSSNYGNSLIDYLDLDPEGPNSIGLSITADAVSSNDSMNLAEFHELRFVPYGGTWANTTAIAITNDRLITFYDADLENPGTAILLNSANRITFFDTYTTACQNYTVLLNGTSFGDRFDGGTLASLTTGSVYADLSTSTDSRHNYLGDSVFVYPGTITLGTETDMGNAYLWNNATNVYSPVFNRGFQTVVNGTWIIHGLWTTPQTVNLYFNQTSGNYVNSTEFYLDPYVIQSNSTAFEVGFYKANIPTSPLNRASGLPVTFNNWGTNPGNNTAETDGNWLTTTSGIGYNNVSTSGGFVGCADLNLGANYTVTVSARYGAFSNTSSITAYWYYSFDGSNWVQASGAGAGSVSSVTEITRDTQVETITAQYIRLGFVTGANSESANVEIFEMQALDFSGSNVNPLTAVTVGVPVSWSAYSQGWTG